MEVREEIRDYIAQVRAVDAGGDYEAAHGVEDDLLWSFVEQHAAAGDRDAQAIIEMRSAPDRGMRWYA